MKNVLSLIGAGLIGGLIVVGANHMMTKKVNVSPKDNYAKFTSDPSVSSGAIDLSTAATVASPTVVYIQAVESEEAAKKRSQREYNNDPFAQFFGGAFSFRQPQKRGTGSGVIISKDGYIVTNNHVVDFADEVSVSLSDKRKFSAKVVGTDPRADLAVLKIDASNLPAIQKGNSDNLRIGEWVLAIGFPYDIGTTVTAGIISATHKKISETRGAVEDFIQTDAVVNPGNSGGALVDAQGRLVGINTAIQTRTGSYEGYSFAIPVNVMSEIADDIIKNGSRKPQEVVAQKGKKPVLGIQMVNDRFFEEAVRELNLGVSEGVIVADVFDGSSAQYSGILPNDVIVKINNDAIRSTQDLREILGTHNIGEVIKVTVYRNGKAKELNVSLRS